MEESHQQYVTWQSMATFFAATVTTTAVTSALVSLFPKWKPKVIAFFVAFFLIEGFTGYLDFVVTDDTTVKHYLADFAIAAVNSLLVYGSVVGAKTVDFRTKSEQSGEVEQGPPKGGRRRCGFCARFDRLIFNRW